MCQVASREYYWLGRANASDVEFCHRDISASIAGAGRHRVARSSAEAYFLLFKSDREIVVLESPNYLNNLLFFNFANTAKSRRSNQLVGSR